MDKTRRDALALPLGQRPSPIPACLEGIPTYSVSLAGTPPEGWRVTVCVDGVQCIERERPPDWYRQTMLGPVLPPLAKDLDLKSELHAADSDST